MTTVNADALFDTCIAEIESAYDRLGHHLGWRFLGVPKAVLRNPVQIALISLNPGGDYEPAEHPRASCEVGNWYISESWDEAPPGHSKLQRQVRLMFSQIAKEMDYAGDSDALISESLISNFVPFRSPSIDRLPCKKESFECARRLWTKLLPLIRPKLVVCLDRDTENALKLLIPTCLGYRNLAASELPIGWGSYKASLHDFGKCAPETRLLYLPHVSRFGIFGREKSAPNVASIFRAACGHLQRKPEPTLAGSGQSEGDVYIR